MYSLIGRQKWWIQIIITVVLVAGIILLYLLGRSWGYDKARAKFEAEDAVKAQKSAELITRAEGLEKRVAELEPKLLAYEQLGEQKKKLDEKTVEKINAVVEEGKARDAVTDAPTDCWTRAQRTCAGFGKLNPPIVIDCEAYKQRICANAITNAAGGCK